MTGYTLIVSKEQQKLTEVCNIFKCLSERLRCEEPDAADKLNPYRACITFKCQQAEKCRVLRQLADVWMNNGL